MLNVILLGGASAGEAEPTPAVEPHSEPDVVYEVSVATDPIGLDAAS